MWNDYNLNWVIRFIEQNASISRRKFSLAGPVCFTVSRPSRFLYFLLPRNSQAWSQQKRKNCHKLVWCTPSVSEWPKRIFYLRSWYISYLFSFIIMLDWNMFFCHFGDGLPSCGHKTANKSVCVYGFSGLFAQLFWLKKFLFSTLHFSFCLSQ